MWAIPREVPVKLPRERFDYVPMARRRPWALPQGARLAVWPIVHIEACDIEGPLKLRRERFYDVPRPRRRAWTRPKGARIAGWTIVNIEEWAIEKPMARQ